MIKVKKIKPLFNRIITTADKYEDVVVNGIIDGTKSNTIKEYQKVIEVGTNVNTIKPGDLVLIDPTRYMVRKHREGSLKDGIITDNPVTGYNFNVVELEDKQCLLLYDADIIYIINDYEEIEDEKVSNIINIKKPQIIV